MHTAINIVEVFVQGQVRYVVAQKCELLWGLLTEHKCVAYSMCRYDFNNENAALFSLETMQQAKHLAIRYHAHYVKEYPKFEVTLTLED